MGKILLLEEDDTLEDEIAQLTDSIELGTRLYCSKNVGDAYKYAMEQEIDLFLVDIDNAEDADVSSIRFIHNLRKIERYKLTPVIILSELLAEEKAICNYTHCYSFFEKPFDKMILRQEIKEIIDASRSNGSGSNNKSLFLKKAGVLYRIMLENIVYMESHNHVLEICTINGWMKFSYISCSDVIEKISTDSFVQCNKSTIVNKIFIEAVDIVNRYVILAGDYGNIDIGPAFKKRFVDENYLR